MDVKFGKKVVGKDVGYVGQWFVGWYLKQECFFELENFIYLKLELMFLQFDFIFVLGYLVVVKILLVNQNLWQLFQW